MPREPLIVGPSRKPEFWAAVEGRAPKKAEVHTKPAKPAQVAPDAHKKAAKAHTAKKKPAKKARRAVKK